MRRWLTAPFRWLKREHSDIVHEQQMCWFAAWVALILIMLEAGVHFICKLAPGHKKRCGFCQTEPEP